jgi:hypothetical protein
MPPPNFLTLGKDFEAKRKRAISTSLLHAADCAVIHEDSRATGRASFSSDHGTVAIDDFDTPALRVEASDKRVSLLRIAANRLDVTSDDGRIEGSELTGVTAQSSDGNVEVANADRSSSETLRVGE